MHEECFDFVRRVKTAVPQAFVNVAAVEIGSRYINGTVRDLFDGGSFVGVDAVEGKGVDVVASGQNTGLDEGAFDTAICTEVFEHTAAWPEIAKEMKRLVRPKGFIIITCATTGRVVHGVDEYGFGYYENVDASRFRRLPLGRLLYFEEDYISCDVRGVWKTDSERLMDARPSGPFRRGRGVKLRDFKR